MIEQVNWTDELQGKTLQSIRTRHEDDGPRPYVAVYFTDGSAYHLNIKPDVYFEAAMFNSLRKAQPVEKVIFHQMGRSTHVEVWARTFPLFLVRAKGGDSFPFMLTKQREGR